MPVKNSNWQYSIYYEKFAYNFTSFGILYQEPNEVGQSGTERPASLLVTSAPAMIRRNIQPARITANRWCPRL